MPIPYRECACGNQIMVCGQTACDVCRATPPRPPLPAVFEPGSEAFDQSIQPVVSIAVSLKRIADTLDGTAIGINVAETIFNPHRG